MHRLQKGFPFNWGPYFYGAHNRNPEGSDGGTGPQPEDTQTGVFFRASLPPALGGSPSPH